MDCTTDTPCPEQCEVARHTCTGRVSSICTQQHGADSAGCMCHTTVCLGQHLCWGFAGFPLHDYNAEATAESQEHLQPLEMTTGTHEQPADDQPPPEAPCMRVLGQQGHGLLGR